MKIKDGYMLRQFGDDYIAVAVGEDAENFNKLITLNDVGAFIYEQLRTEKTLDELVEAMVGHYDVEEHLARGDAMVFIQELTEAGLLDE